MKKVQSLVQMSVSLALFMGCSSSNDDPAPAPVNQLPVPVFSAYSPETAFIGDEITITGENFGTNPAKLSVTFGGVDATVVSVTNTSAKVIVPNDIEQSAAKIKFVLNEYSKTADNDFKLKAPIIESMSPASGLPGQSVTIKGKGFRKSSKFDQISFAGTPVKASSITVVSNTELTMIIPDDAVSGQYSIAVTVAGMSGTAPDKFEVTGLPLFSSFSPETAFIGEEITITGDNLGTDPDQLRVTFGSVEATVVSVDKTTAKVIVPDDIEAATVKIKVVSADYSKTSDSDFKVKAPVIESISHTKGFSGQRITVKGKGFRNSYHFDQVKFGSIPIPRGSVIPPGNTELRFSAPDNAAAGKYSISITVLGMTATAVDQFEVFVPTITSFTPEIGTQFTAMTITGTNFIDANGGSTSVFFRDKQTGLQLTIASIRSITETEINVSVPTLVENRRQGWTVSVSVVSGTATAANVFSYTE